MAMAMRHFISIICLRQSGKNSLTSTKKTEMPGASYATFFGEMNMPKSFDFKRIYETKKGADLAPFSMFFAIVLCFNLLCKIDQQWCRNAQ